MNRLGAGVADYFGNRYISPITIGATMRGTGASLHDASVEILPSRLWISAYSRYPAKFGAGPGNNFA